MKLNKKVQVVRRFLRSIRIDTDLEESANLEGFICTQSHYDLLKNMIRHVSETKQGAFTWTGPYGSGKSSLVVALSSLLSSKARLRKKAEEVFGNEFTKDLRQTLPLGTKGWQIVPIVGVRDDPVRVMGDALRREGVIKRKPRGGWNEVNLITALTKTVIDKPDDHDGIILFIDEMGKFLESAVRNGFDIYVLQQLAELASRSDGRFLLVGILHQSFEEYTLRLSLEARDEWAKIQGRFIDLIVDATGEEQIELLSQAIVSTHKTTQKIKSVCNAVSKASFGGSQTVANGLVKCWPLHPIVACLLGPISRRRFGQNQRSLFGFLSSAEPFGFQDFIKNASLQDLYTPDMLWDYLRANLEPSILASPDGHRWALATEALERCEAQGGEKNHIKLLKIIAVMDLFKERSKIGPSNKLLNTCFSKKELKEALERLKGGSFTIFKEFNDAHAIFAGSDFDIQKELNFALEEIDKIDFVKLQQLAGIQPVVAKRHYNDTGALRWFDVEIAPLKELRQSNSKFDLKNGAMGKFILVVPTEGEIETEAKKLCNETAKKIAPRDILLGLSKISWVITSLARELLALELIYETNPELTGDSVARREISSRIAELKSLLETEMFKSFDNAVWFSSSSKPTPYRQSELNNLVSNLADKRFKKSPKIHNELLNRHKPSGSAVGAQNNLLRRMLFRGNEQRLGIEKYPAEAGLYESILKKSGLHREIRGKWCLASPDKNFDICNLDPLWVEAIELIKRSPTTISVIYDLWRKPPYGVKDGLLPLLAVCFILTQQERLAVYREGVFKAKFDDVDVDYLLKDASSIQLRWMDISGISRKLLLEMANIVRELDNSNKLDNLEPIDVARGLVAIYDKLPPWTKRTMLLSSNAKGIREMFKRARDPNKFLFDDIPETFAKNANDINANTLKKLANNVRDGLTELISAYASMLDRIRDVMLRELHVHNTSAQSLLEMQLRANNIRQIAGDFKLEAFINRIAEFSNDNESIEGIASLAANKPPRLWNDLDFDKTLVEIADLSQKFLRAETFARVKGRSNKRHAMAVVVGIDGKPTPVHDEFTISDSERQDVKRLVDQIDSVVGKNNEMNRSVILTALAELSAHYLGKNTEVNKKTEQQKRVA